MKEYIFEIEEEEIDEAEVFVGWIRKHSHELVRCKDCKYWMPHMQFGYDEDSDKYHNYCKMHLPDDDFYAFIKEAEDYCSWAERKEE